MLSSMYYTILGGIRMRRKIILLVTILIAILSFFTFFNYLPTNIPNINEIEFIEVHIGGEDQEENSHYIFSNKENLLRITKIHKQLLNYIDPRVKTWFLDVKITYELKNGDRKSVVFKKVRPANDYFQEVFNSLEYKKQTLAIFNINESDIQKIKLKDSYIDRHKSVVIEDKNIIHAAYTNSLKTYELFDTEEDYYYIANIEFYDCNDKVIATGNIIREHNHWHDFFRKYKKVASIKASPLEVKEIIITNDKTNKRVVITDNSIISTILDTYYDCHHGIKSSQYSVEIILKDSSMRHWHGSFFNNKIPDIIIDSFKK